MQPLRSLLLCLAGFVLHVVLPFAPPSLSDSVSAASASAAPHWRLWRTPFAALTRLLTATWRRRRCRRRCAPPTRPGGEWWLCLAVGLDGSCMCMCMRMRMAAWTARRHHAALPAKCTGRWLPAAAVKWRQVWPSCWHRCPWLIMCCAVLHLPFSSPQHPTRD